MKVNIQTLLGSSVQESQIPFDRLDPNIKYYKAGARIHDFLLKKPVSVLNPFTDDVKEKEIIRAVLEDYLKSVISTFTRKNLVVESERLLPRFHLYKGHYYLFAGLGGYIRNRRQVGYRPEFIEVQVGAGSHAKVFKTATVIFDEHHSFTLKRSDKKPRALKKRMSSDLDETFISVMSSLPYKEYKLKQCFYTVEKNENYLYIPHRFFEGANLGEYLKQHSLTGIEKMSLEIAAAEAVDRLRERSIIHRDIKPANLMVSSDGKVITIIDYDYAIFPGPVDTVAGSPMYLAPECFNEDFSYKTDGYAALIGFAEGFGTISRVSAETERFVKQQDPMLPMRLNIQRAQQKQKFRKFAVNDTDIPMSLRKFIKVTLQEGTHPQPDRRLPLKEVLTTLKNYQSLLVSGDPEELRQKNLQYVEKYLINSIQKKWDFCFSITDRLTLIEKAIEKLPDDAECIKMLFTALQVMSFTNLQSKAELKNKLAMLDVAYETSVAMVDYADLLKHTMQSNDKSQLACSLMRFKVDEYQRYLNDLSLVEKNNDIDLWVLWSERIKSENFNFKKIISITLDMICMQQQSLPNSNQLYAISHQQNIQLPLLRYFSLLIDKEQSDQEKMLLIISMLTRFPQLVVKLNRYSFCFLNVSRYDHAEDFMNKITNQLNMKPEEIDEALIRVNQLFDGWQPSVLRQ